MQELTIDVQNIVFAPLSSAQVVLNREARSAGPSWSTSAAAPPTSRCTARVRWYCPAALPVGGDHITNDIATVLDLPQAKAEQLKITEGCAMPGDPNVTEFIHMPDDRGFVGRSVKREELDSIIQARVEEIFELLKDAWPPMVASPASGPAYF